MVDTHATPSPSSDSRPAEDGTRDIPQVEVDEVTPPRPEEEVADVARQEPRG